MNLENYDCDLIKEAISMSHFNHPNLVKFYGVCFDSINPKYIVLEYMNLGDLLAYLRHLRTTKVSLKIIYSAFAAEFSQ